MRNPLWVRSLRAFFRLPRMRGFAVLLVAFLAVLTAAVAIFNVRYEHPTEGRLLDLSESIYAVFSLMFFGSGYPWPKDEMTRALFFLVPLTGMAVVGQTVLGLTSAVVNRSRWEIAMASTLHDHVIVCGLGRVGARVVRWLKEMDEDVVVIELDESHPRIKEIRASGVPVLIGDAASADQLDEANISRAESIVPCTADDLTNLRIATAARAKRQDITVVLRTFDDTLAKNIKSGFDIQYAYSTSALAAPAFAAAATSVPVDYAFTFGDRKMLLTITEFEVVEDSPLVDCSIVDLETNYGVEALAVDDGKVTLNPNDDYVLRVGCRFVVSGSLDAISKVNEVTPPVREMGRYYSGRWKGRA